MKSLFAVLLIALNSTGAVAQDSARDVSAPLITEADTLDGFLWTARPVVVFADTPNDPRFIEQISLLEAGKSALLDRDVVVIVDTDPDARTAIRQKLRPRGFQLTLIGKDGEVKLRKPTPWSVREITRSIDQDAPAPPRDPRGKTSRRGGLSAFAKSRDFAYIHSRNNAVFGGYPRCRNQLIPPSQSLAGRVRARGIDLFRRLSQRRVALLGGDAPALGIGLDHLQRIIAVVFRLAF